MVICMNLYFVVTFCCDTYEMVLSFSWHSTFYVMRPCRRLETKTLQWTSYPGTNSSQHFAMTSWNRFIRVPIAANPFDGHRWRISSATTWATLEKNPSSACTVRTGVSSLPTWRDTSMCIWGMSFERKVFDTWRLTGSWKSRKYHFWEVEKYLYTFKEWGSWWKKRHFK